VVTAALRKIAGLVSILTSAVIKDRHTTGLNAAKSNGESLRKAVENSRVPVTDGALAHRVVGVVSLRIQEPARAAGQAHRLRKQARVVTIVAVVVHMKRDTPHS